MKNKGLIGVICGIILIGAGSFLLLTNNEKNSNTETYNNENGGATNTIDDEEIEALEVNATVYVNTDKEFKYVFIERDEENDKYYIHARSREYKLEEGAITPEDHGIQYNVKQSGFTYESEKHQLKFIIDGDKATFTIDNPRYENLNGEYKTYSSNAKYSLNNDDESTIKGFYSLDNESNKIQFTIADLDSENYTISGYINKDKKYYIFSKNKISKETNTFSDSESEYTFSINNNELTIKSSNSDSVVNGTYKKAVGFYYNQLINSMEKNAIANKGTEMSY